MLEKHKLHHMTTHENEQVSSHQTTKSPDLGEYGHIQNTELKRAIILTTIQSVTQQRFVYVYLLSWCNYFRCLG